jgi:hypothetical protein
MNPLHGEIATKKEEGYGHADRESMIFALNPTMTLYVHTDNPNRKMLIVCHKEDTISKEMLINNKQFLRKVMQKYC